MKRLLVFTFVFLACFGREAAAQNLERTLEKFYYAWVGDQVQLLQAENLGFIENQGRHLRRITDDLRCYGSRRSCGLWSPRGAYLPVTGYDPATGRKYPLTTGGKWEMGIGGGLMATGGFALYKDKPVEGMLLMGAGALLMRDADRRRQKPERAVVPPEPPAYPIGDLVRQPPQRVVPPEPVVQPQPEQPFFSGAQRSLTARDCQDQGMLYVRNATAYVAQVYFIPVEGQKEILAKLLDGETACVPTPNEKQMLAFDALTHVASGEYNQFLRIVQGIYQVQPIRGGAELQLQPRPTPVGGGK